MNNSNDIMIILLKENWVGNNYQIKSDQLFPDISGTLCNACLTDEEYASLKAARISCNYVLDTGSLTLMAIGIVPTTDIHLKLTIKDNGGFIINLPADGGDADTLGKKEPAYFASKDDYLALLSRIEAAEQELEKKISKNMSPQFFLASSGWDENKHQTLPCDKFTAGSTVIPAYFMPESNIDACSKAGISIHSTTETTITFSCSNVPSVDVVVGAMYQGESDVKYEILDEVGTKEVVWYTEEMLPDPNVLLFLNAEGDEPYKDKSLSNQTIVKVNSAIGNTGSFQGCVKGSHYYTYESTYSKDPCEILRIDNIANFDPSKEWQFTFACRLYGSGIHNNINIMHFDGLNCGFKTKKSSSSWAYVWFYYHNSAGELKEIDTNLGINFGYEYWQCCNISLRYMKDTDGAWKYFINIINAQDGKSSGTQQPQIVVDDIKEHLSTDSTNLVLGWASSNATVGSLDEIILKSKADTQYKYPTVNNLKDGYPETIPTQVEHTATVEVKDNTILRYNTNGTVDEYRTIDVPIPYEPNSSTITLLHCDEMKASDECGNSVTYYENVSVDTENKMLGTGSFKVDRIFKQVELGFQVITNKAVKNTSKITFECNLLLDINNYQTGYKTIYLLQVWDKSNNNYQGFALYLVYTASTNKWELRLSISESGTSFDQGSPTMHSFEETDIFGKWIHLAVAIDFSGNVCNVYLDGVCVKNTTLHSYKLWNGNFNKFKIAHTSIGSSSETAFGGYIDEIRLSEGMLTIFGNTKKEGEWVRL